MQQERYADAFLIAVAAWAGCNLAKPEVDDDSVDWTLSCRIPPRRPRLDLQMKSYSNDDGVGNNIQFPLKKKNYDDLIVTDLLVPRLLIVVRVPADMEDWVDYNASRMVLQNAAYWVSLAGLPATSNTTSVTVSVPRANLFDVAALNALMNTVNGGGVP